MPKPLPEKYRPLSLQNIYSAPKVDNRKESECLQKIRIEGIQYQRQAQLVY